MSDHTDFTESRRLSRSAQKTELKGVQDIADLLVGLTAGDLRNMPLEGDLRDLIEATRRISAHSARRRQMRFLSKRLGGCDLTLVRRALASLKHGQSADVLKFQELEVLRDQVIAGNEATLETVLARFPAANLKELSKLQANAKATIGTKSGTIAARALYRHLRRLAELPSPADAPVQEH